MMSLGSCGDAKEQGFSSNGIYTVCLNDTDISFEARIDGECERYVFISPPTLNGLTATTYDGVNYTLEFNDIQSTATSKAIDAATDFSAALRLLESARTVKKITTSVTIDGLSAYATFDGKGLARLSFYDGNAHRNYTITTEATG